MNTPSQADTSAVANQLVRLMTAGTTERELVATVAGRSRTWSVGSSLPRCRTRPQPPRSALPGCRKAGERAACYKNRRQNGSAR